MGLGLRFYTGEDEDDGSGRPRAGAEHGEQAGSSTRRGARRRAPLGIGRGEEMSEQAKKVGAWEPCGYCGTYFRAWLGEHGCIGQSADEEREKLHRALETLLHVATPVGLLRARGENYAIGASDLHDACEEAFKTLESCRWLRGDESPNPVEEARQARFEEEWGNGRLD